MRELRAVGGMKALILFIRLLRACDRGQSYADRVARVLEISFGTFRSDGLVHRRVLRQTPAAFGYVEGGHARGKVVITV